MVEFRFCSVFLLVRITILFQSVSAKFDYTCDAIPASNNSNISLKSARANILQYYRELSHSASHPNETHYRFKRYDVTTFRGHPKTREERWHSNFNLNGTSLEMEQTQSLVVLLNKIIDKYLMACIPIVFYDKYVEQSEGIVLQTFFQVPATLTEGECKPFFFHFRLLVLVAESEDIIFAWENRRELYSCQSRFAASVR